MRKKTYKALLNILLFGGAMLLIALLCLCCSPTQRLSRLVERHPELVRQVTVEVPVMHIVPEHVVIDTILLFKHDTLRFETATAAGFIVPLDTVIRINVIVKQDTIRDTVEIEVPQVTATISDKGGFPYWIIPVSLVLLLIMIIIIKIR